MARSGVLCDHVKHTMDDVNEVFKSQGALSRVRELLRTSFQEVYIGSALEPAVAAGTIAYALSNGVFDGDGWYAVCINGACLLRYVNMRPSGKLKVSLRRPNDWGFEVDRAERTENFSFIGRVVGFLSPA